MKKIILSVILTLFVLSLFSQNPADSIQVKKGLGTVFLQNGKALTPRQLVTITKSNPEASAEMKIAKSNSGFSTVLGYAGGFLAGWPVGTALAGGDPDWTLAAIGAGLIVISIPFTSAYTKHAKNAVSIYNNGLNRSSYRVGEARLGFTFNGIGLKVTF